MKDLINLWLNEEGIDSEQLVAAFYSSGKFYAVTESPDKTILLHRSDLASAVSMTRIEALHAGVIKAIHQLVSNGRLERKDLVLGRIGESGKALLDQVGMVMPPEYIVPDLAVILEPFFKPTPQA